MPCQMVLDQVKRFYDFFPKNRATHTGFLGASDPVNEGA